MTQTQNTDSLKVRPEDRAKVETLLDEAVLHGHASLRLEIADGKLVSGGIEKKFKVK